MLKIKRLLHKYKEKRYMAKREEDWKRFKQNNNKFKCGIVHNAKYSWEYECTHNLCMEKDYFEKYGCMYVKGFKNY